MKKNSVFFAIFISALLILVLAVAIWMRTNAPPAAGLVGQLAMPGPMSSAHQTFAGQCTACHTPGVGVQTRTCRVCHAGTDFGFKQSTQFHGRVAQCTSCHIEHEGDRGVIKMNHAALADPEMFGNSSHFPNLNNTNLGPTSTLDCASCHAIRDRHLGLFGKKCENCHTTESWEVDGYRHPSTNSTECNECHKAPPSHFMEHFKMVSQRASNNKARVDQCYACHTTDSFNNIRQKGWYDHH